MKKLFLILAAGSLFLFSGCKKNGDSKKNTTQIGNDAMNDAIIQSAYSEMPSMSDQAMSGTMVYFKSGQVNIINKAKKEAAVYDKSSCNVIITIDTVGSIDSLTIDWGTTNCTCNDGKKRRGKIITTWTGSYYDQGTVITHIPVDYYVNDNKIEGTMTIKNMGTNSNSQPYYNVDINGTATMTSGDIINYTSSRVRTFTNGSSTQLYFLDDEYDITGTATGTTQDGDGWNTNVTSALHVKIGCPYITKGIVNITPNNLPTRTINYGNGACDANFSVTINGQTYNITY